MRQRQGFQRLLELAVQDRIEEADALDLGHPQRTHAVTAPQVEQFRVNGILGDGDLLLLDADDSARQGARLRGVGLL